MFFFPPLSLSLLPTNATYQGLKDSSAGGRNFLNSTSRSRKRLKKSGQTPPEDNLPCEPQPWQLLHQKKMLATNGGLEMPQTALPIINGKGMEADLEAKSVTHQSPESKVILNLLFLHNFTGGR